MATASAAVQPNVKIGPTKLLINGRWVDSASGKTFPTINPSTGEVITQVAESDAADVDKAVSAARAAFEKGPWRKMSASQRGILMNKFADLIEKHADELAQLEALDNGKPAHIARVARPAAHRGVLPLLRWLGGQDSRQDHSGQWPVFLLHQARSRSALWDKSFPGTSRS